VGVVMIIREDFAGHRWCPFVRVSRPSDRGAWNRRSDGAEDPTHRMRGTQCLGMACMAWRQVEDLVEVDTRLGTTTYHRQGFCGLAGKPED